MINWLKSKLRFQKPIEIPSITWYEEPLHQNCRCIAEDFKMNRYEVVFRNIDKECLRAYHMKDFGIYDTKKGMALPCNFSEELEAQIMCNILNELAREQKSNKPKPLKEEILEALGEIDISKYDMQNKILKQKEHIKELETRIKHLKNDVKNNQRSINSLSRKCDLCNYKTDYEFKEYENKCLKSEISNLKREKEEYRKRFIKIQEEIDCTYIPISSKFNKIKRIMEGYYD